MNEASSSQALAQPELRPRLHIEAHVKTLGGSYEKPTVKQHLAVIRMVIDWLVETGNVRGADLAVSLRLLDYAGDREELVVIAFDAGRPVSGINRHDLHAGRRRRTRRAAPIFSVVDAVVFAWATSMRVSIGASRSGAAAGGGKITGIGANAGLQRDLRSPVEMFLRPADVEKSNIVVFGILPLVEIDRACGRMERTIAATWSSVRRVPSVKLKVCPDASGAASAATTAAATSATWTNCRGNPLPMEGASPRRRAHRGSWSG